MRFVLGCAGARLISQQVKMSRLDQIHHTEETRGLRKSPIRLEPLEIIAETFVLVCIGPTIATQPAGSRL